LKGGNGYPTIGNIGYTCHFPILCFAYVFVLTIFSGEVLTRAEQREASYRLLKQSHYYLICCEVCWMREIQYVEKGTENDFGFEKNTSEIKPNAVNNIICLVRLGRTEVCAGKMRSRHTSSASHVFVPLLE
jgi:hypothetical protein